MKKSRGFASTMNYYSVGGGGGGGGPGEEEAGSDDPSLDPSYPPRRYGYPPDYHSYPTAPRDYSMRGANANYRNDAPSYRNDPPKYRNEVPEYRNEAHNYRNDPQNYSKEAQNYRNEEQNYRNEAHNYRNEAHNYRNEAHNYRNEAPKFRNEPREYREGSRSFEEEHRDFENTNYQGHRDYGSLGRNYRHDPPAYHSNQDQDRGEFGSRSQEYRGHRYGTSPRHRYRSPEDYHYDYRGGYRPSLDPDGYTTDGSGSGCRDGSVRGYKNYRYPEREALLPSRDSTPNQPNGDTYPRGEGGGGGEKQPFLGAGEPVRLTPSWENSNLPKEELNFRSVNTFETFEMGVDPPKDRFRLVFMTLVLHGVGTLMPWNMFITAKNYFVEYKLNTDDDNMSAYSTNFLPYIGYASQIPNVLFNWLNIFIQMGGNLTTRIVWSILVEVVVFVFTVILAMVDSSDWPGVFFWLTICSVVILNVAGGIYQNTVYGMAARLPFSYTGAVVLGSNISGTFTAVINIVAIAMAPNTRTSAIYYFITALFVLLACFDTYFALPLNRFFRYHEAMYERTQKASKRDPRKPRVPYWHIFKSAFPQLFNVFMVFFVTLAVFPAVLADTCRTEENFPVSPKYFQAVTCFLTFNLFAMLGNMLPGLFTWPSPRFLCVPVLLRVMLIPAFVLCHFYPIKVERVMPVLIDSDWAYWVLSVILGITSGYYSSLAMMYCPRTVEPEHAPVAGMMGAASLITGIFSGILFQLVCTWAVTNISFEIPGYDFPMRNCTNRIS